MKGRASASAKGEPKAKVLRCAVYTRVSTDHGLEQEFNSLDNQREASLAYVASQTHEGWQAVREHYDDGGFSGGSLERPALTRLLRDIANRRIDVVVVYKVDRLTRSLADFAKLVELFDAHGVAFVSVTQSFNTTSSMGRLTLNVLLSFAQFEREVTGERIRDKIAASKRKGIWVGGVVPLGYRVQDRKLVVDEAEAVTVRLVFERYLVLGSLSALQQDLRDRAIVTRVRAKASGQRCGGVALTNGPLQYMLRNRTYLGELNHRQESYPGEHAAIIDRAVFEAVQARLDGNRVERTQARLASPALLLGLIQDDRGNPMTPSHAVKKGARYRYYVSCVLAQGRKAEAGSVPRIAAPDVEAIVLEALQALTPQQPHDPHQTEADRVRYHVQRVTVSSATITLQMNDTLAGAISTTPIVIPWSAKSLRRRREIIGVSDGAATSNRPIRAEARSKLLQRIARARGWVEAMMEGRIADIETIAAREAISLRAARMTLSLAFLAPDIVTAAAEGILPRGFGVSRLIDLPMQWEAQRHAIGLVRASTTSKH